MVFIESNTFVCQTNKNRVLIKFTWILKQTRKTAVGLFGPSKRTCRLVIRHLFDNFFFFIILSSSCYGGLQPSTEAKHLFRLGSQQINLQQNNKWRTLKKEGKNIKWLKVKRVEGKYVKG